MDKRSNEQYEYVTLLSTNSMVLNNVNVNAQLIFWKGFRILNESKLNLVDPDFYRKPSSYARFLLLNYFRRKSIGIEKVLWVVDDWSVNYYHWLVDALPRILSTRMDLSDFTVVLPTNVRSPFQARTLELMGIRYRYFDAVSERVHARELYLPLYVSIAGTTNPWYVGKVRELILDRVGRNKGERKDRVYVTRRRALKRKISNEAEVLRIVEGLDFKVVEFENLTFEQQVTLCNGAGILVGLHGAGLTNLMFMEKGSVVLELRRENEQNLCFTHLANAMEMKYRSLECKNVGTDVHNSDFCVNLAEFEGLIRSLL